MSDTPTVAPPRHPAAGCAWLLATLLLSVVWLGVLVVVTGVVLVLTQGPELRVDDLPGWLNVLVFTGFFGGLVGLGALYGRLTGRTVRGAFAWVRPPPAVLAAAMAGGLTVGLLPGWLAGALEAPLGDWSPGTLGHITAGLTEGPLADRLAMGLMVVGLAPVFEELVFRGFLWDMIASPLRAGAGSRWPAAVPGVVALVVTSLLFGMFHVDPVQGIPVVLTGAFLGWVRLVSGSVWPAIAAHGVNNLLAAVVTLLVGDLQHGSAESVPFWLAALGASLTLLFAFVAWRARPRDPSPG